MPVWTAADLPSFAGRTVIVTGASAGLGEVTARELARVGAHVILAVRNTELGRQRDLQVAEVGERADVLDQLTVARAACLGRRRGACQALEQGIGEQVARPDRRHGPGPSPLSLR